MKMSVVETVKIVCTPAHLARWMRYEGGSKTAQTGSLPLSAMGPQAAAFPVVGQEDNFQTKLGQQTHALCSLSH